MTMGAEAPKFHFRRPDVVVYRCIDSERGKWGRKPYASDCVIVLEIISADSVATDLRAKRAEYAAYAPSCGRRCGVDAPSAPSIGVRGA